MKLLKTVRRLRRIITIPPGGPRLNSPLKKGTVPLGCADMPGENQLSERDSPLFQHGARRLKALAALISLMALGVLFVTFRATGAGGRHDPSAIRQLNASRSPIFSAAHGRNEALVQIGRAHV